MTKAELRKQLFFKAKQKYLISDHTAAKSACRVIASPDRKSHLWAFAKLPQRLCAALPYKATVSGGAPCRNKFVQALLIWKKALKLRSDIKQLLCGNFGLPSSAGRMDLESEFHLAARKIHVRVMSHARSCAFTM